MLGLEMMVGSFLKNLPPETLKKVDDIAQTVATWNARLSELENGQRRILAILESEHHGRKSADDYQRTGEQSGRCDQQRLGETDARQCADGGTPGNGGETGRSDAAQHDAFERDRQSSGSVVGSGDGDGSALDADAR